jgi:hypothetical protein
MTDEERQKLCERLNSPWTATDDDCTLAADEIERLAEITERYKKLSKYLCTIIRQRLIELEEINND